MAPYLYRGAVMPGPTTYRTRFRGPCGCDAPAIWRVTSHSPTGEAPFDTTYEIRHPGECRTDKGSK